MSNEKELPKSGRGGARPGAGRGSGDKTKISVSVDEDNWQNALTIWKRKPSWLVDELVANYVAGHERSQEARAV